MKQGCRLEMLDVSRLVEYFFYLPYLHGFYLKTCLLLFASIKRVVVNCNQKFHIPIARAKWTWRAQMCNTTQEINAFFTNDWHFESMNTMSTL